MIVIMNRWTVDVPDVQRDSETEPVYVEPDTHVAIDSMTWPKLV